MELDHVVGLFVEVQLVEPNIGVLARLIEVGLHHFQERDVLAFGGEPGLAHQHERSGQTVGDYLHLC